MTFCDLPSGSLYASIRNPSFLPTSTLCCGKRRAIPVFCLGPCQPSSCCFLSLLAAVWLFPTPSKAGGDVDMLSRSVESRLPSQPSAQSLLSTIDSHHHPSVADSMYLSLLWLEELFHLLPLSFEAWLSGESWPTICDWWGGRIKAMVQGRKREPREADPATGLDTLTLRSAFNEPWC